MRPIMSRADVTWVRWWLAGSVLFVLGVTLYPFIFEFGAASGVDSVADVLRTFDLRPQQPDIPENIVMFVPFGFGLGGLLRQRRGARLVVGLVFLAGASLSFTVEVLQVFLPSRFTSVSDVVHNSLGSVVGSYVFLRWHAVFFRVTRGITCIWQRHALAWSVGLFTVYTALFLLAAFALKHTATFADWDPSFSLMVGNEQDAARPWQGRLADLVISDRAAIASEVARLAAGDDPASVLGAALVSTYPLRGEAPHRDEARHSPDLLSCGASPAFGAEGHVETSPNSWLESAGPAAVVAERMSRTSQITLAARVASLVVPQRGPARVISVSAGTDRRNVTLGQEGADLVIRLRTRFADENGRGPEMIGRDFFAERGTHHLAFTYDGAVARVYRDGAVWRESRFHTPEFLSFLLLWDNSPAEIELQEVEHPWRRIVFYLLFFAPVGPLLGKIHSLRRERFPKSGATLAVIGLSWCILAEVVLAVANSRPPNVTGLVMGCGIASLGFLFRHLIGAANR